MATNENLIPIPGRLHSVATEGHVAGADEIFDDELNKTQDTINREVNAALGTGGSVDSRIAAAINALDATKSQSAGADGLALNIVEENGKITSISGSIASNTYDAYGAASSEATRAQSAEGALNTRVGSLETTVGPGGSIDTRIDNAIDEALENGAFLGDNDGSTPIPGFDPVSEVSSLKSRTSANESDIDGLQAAYRGLTQSAIKVVEDHTQVSSPVANTIYREQGTNSYIDWMYYGGAWKKMAEYDNAIDDVPTAGSNNLVKSGGVAVKIEPTDSVVLTNAPNNVYPDGGTWHKVGNIIAKYVAIADIKDFLVVTASENLRAVMVLTDWVSDTAGGSYTNIGGNIVIPANTTRKFLKTDFPSGALYIYFTDNSAQQQAPVKCKLPSVVNNCANTSIGNLQSQIINANEKSELAFYDLPFTNIIYPDEGYYRSGETNQVFCSFMRVKEGDILYIKTKTYPSKFGFLTEFGGDDGDPVSYAGGQTTEIVQDSYTTIRYVVPTGANYFFANDSSKRSWAPEDSKVEIPLVFYQGTNEECVKDNIKLSYNPLNEKNYLREQLIIEAPYQGKKFVDNVIALKNNSHDGTIHGLAAISFMDDNYNERAAFGYSHNNQIQPNGGFIANTLYCEIGNAFGTNPLENTDFRVVNTLKNVGRFYPLEILASGEINFNIRDNKKMVISGGPVQAEEGIILKSPNGTYYKLMVNNQGELSITPIS